MEKVVFSEFIKHELTKQLLFNDLSQLIKKQKVGYLLPIDKDYGAGEVTMLPLIADSTLVIFEFTPHRDLEVYQTQIIQKGLSFTINLSGSMVFIADEKRFYFDKNQTSLQKTEQKLAYGATQFFKGQKYCQVTLHLSHEWLSQRGEILSLALLQDDFWLGSYFAGNLTDQASVLCNQLVNEKELQSNFHLTSAQALSLWGNQLPVIAKLNIGSSNKNQMHKASDVSCIRQAASILEKNMQSPPDIQSLAKLVGINDHKLKQGFNYIYKQPPFTYLRERRLSRARDLLTQGVSVTKVAEEVGYKSVSHFSSVYKKRFGQTPNSSRLFERFE